MKYILFLVLTLTAVSYACSSAKKARLSDIKQGITGQITQVSGNRMPSPDVPTPKPKGVLTNVLIYEPTGFDQVARVGTSPVYTAIHTKQVASVMTDSTGHFTVALPAGSYSVFLQQGKQFYANLFDVNNKIALFTVEENKVTTVNLTISSAATF